MVEPNRFILCNVWPTGLPHLFWNGQAKPLGFSKRPTGLNQEWRSNQNWNPWRSSKNMKWWWQWARESQDSWLFVRRNTRKSETYKKRLERQSQKELDLSWFAYCQSDHSQSWTIYSSLQFKNSQCFLQGQQFKWKLKELRSLPRDQGPHF